MRVATLPLLIKRFFMLATNAETTLQGVFSAPQFIGLETVVPGTNHVYLAGPFQDQLQTKREKQDSNFEAVHAVTVYNKCLFTRAGGKM